MAWLESEEANSSALPSAWQITNASCGSLYMTLNLNQFFSYCEIKTELFIWNIKKGTALWTLNFLFWYSIFPNED